MGIVGGEKQKERNKEMDTEKGSEARGDRKRDTERQKEGGGQTQAGERDRHLESRKGHWWSQKQRAKAQLLWARRKKERRRWLGREPETGVRWAKSPVWKEQGGRRGGELGFTAVLSVVGA